MARLTSARLKLNRAREHVEAVDEYVERWLGTDAYTVVREKDPETGYTVARAKIQGAPPPELSLLIGDAIQNFRSALDHTVYALAESQLGTLPPEVAEVLMFPVVGNQNRKGQPANGETIFADLVEHRGYLHGVPDPARAFIEQEQPYHWGDGYRHNPLWLVHDLNRIDKHRRVALTTAWLDLQYLSHPSGVDDLKVTFRMAEGPVADDDVLVVYSGAEEGVGSYFERGVAINQPTSPDIAAVEKTLASIQQRVEWVVASLERFSSRRPRGEPGSSRFTRRAAYTEKGQFPLLTSNTCSCHSANTCSAGSSLWFSSQSSSGLC